MEVIPVEAGKVLQKQCKLSEVGSRSKDSIIKNCGSSSRSLVEVGTVSGVEVNPGRQNVEAMPGKRSVEVIQVEGIQRPPKMVSKMMALGLASFFQACPVNPIESEEKSKGMRGHVALPRNKEQHCP